MQLTMVATGMVKVLRIEGGFGMMDRLKPMGILLGQNIEILRNDNPGPLIVSVNGNMMSLQRATAQKIHVR